MVCAKSVPHTLKPQEKDLRIFHYSPDMAPCDFYLFGKLHLAMKGKRYAVVAIQKTSTAILNATPALDLKKSFDNLLYRANR